MYEFYFLESGKVNYWGYNFYVFMVFDLCYVSKDVVNELKIIICELYCNGI